MEKELMIHYLNDAEKEIMISIDNILASACCDNVDVNFLKLLDKAVDSDYSEVGIDLYEEMHQWGECEQYQNSVLALIQYAIAKGFLLGFHAKPTFHILQIQDIS